MRRFDRTWPVLKIALGRRLCVVRFFVWVVAPLIAAGAVNETRAQETKTLALIPFENVSGSVESTRMVMPLIEQGLRRKGYEIVGLEKIEDFLLRNRVRNSGMMSRGQLDALRKEFGVELVLLGSVDLFSESGAASQWCLSARVVSTADGKILWAESTGRTGDDFTGILALGTVTSGTVLAEKVVRILMESLPRQGGAFNMPQDRPGRRFDWVRASNCIASLILCATGSNFHWFLPKANYRSARLDDASRWRVAVAIFENASERRGAGRIMTDVVTTALFDRGRFEVIDPGELNEKLILLGRTPYGGLDHETLRDLKQRTGLQGVFIGTVYRYNEGLKQEAFTSPEIALDMTMLDAETGNILWFAAADRTGDDTRIALEFGTIRSIVPLIRKTVGEIFESL